ncbi:hypothetical protein Vadar_003276 [Vaccinium darrowii]|uniref:Uncharacterized protein n=1 Tax=Vaccinium darrowii TaxID=229202 RepID=A0ACB7WXR9_9ERIC|nr:hypothetical protein Vadar_003276 [Vaccinium darrowii]
MDPKNRGLPMESDGGGIDSSDSDFGSEFLEEIQSGPRPLVRRYSQGNFPLRSPGAGFSSWFWEEREVDLYHAYHGGPWSMRGGLLVLEFWQPSLSLVITHIGHTAVWVQLHNLLLECFCEDAGRRLGRLIGDVLEVDVHEGISRNIRFLRVRVRIDLDQPIISGISLSRPRQADLWAKCRCERVYKVCRAYGIIGHTLPQCNLSRDEAQMQIDRWLRDICERFGTQVVVHDHAPLYTSNI